MLILGTDIALLNTGWVLVDDENGKVLGNGCISSEGKSGYDRIFHVCDSLFSIVKNIRAGVFSPSDPTFCVCSEEYVAGGRGRRIAMEISKIHGIFFYYLNRNSVPVYTVHPSQLRSFQRFNFSCPSGKMVWSVHEEDAWGLAKILRVKLCSTSCEPTLDFSHDIGNMIERIGTIFGTKEGKKS